MQRLLAVLAGGMISASAAWACSDEPAPDVPPVASVLASPATTAPPADVTRFPPPVLPTQSPAAGGGSLIPEGFLFTEEVAKKPLNQQGVSWTRNDGADLPGMLAPCGTPLPAPGGGAIAGRQLVLINETHLWKAQRLVVYRDATAAARVLAELRDAPTQCARHDEGNGRHTEWQVQPVDIGEEGFYVGGQMYAGTAPLSFHYRGVVFREGRAVHILLDHGSSTVAPTIEEVGPMTESIEMAAALAAADWAK